MSAGKIFEKDIWLGSVALVQDWLSYSSGRDLYARKIDCTAIFQGKCLSDCPVSRNHCATEAINAQISSIGLGNQAS
jgi:hypothetical protein